MILRIAVLVALLITGCGRGTGDTELISRETFVEVNFDLRQIRPEAEDAEERRAEVLQKHGLTQEQLLDFVERGGHSPAQLREIWSEITSRLEDAKLTDDRPTGQSI